MTTATVETAPDQSAAPISFSSLVETIDRLVSNFLSGPDAEMVHDIRVATRRLRAALSISTHESAEALADEVKWLTDTLSSTRESDVLAETVNARIQRRGDEFVASVQPLTLALRNTANLQRGRAARSLRSNRYTKLIEALRGFAGEPEAELNVNGANGATASPVAPEISKRLKKLHKATKQSFEQFDQDSLHQTRISAKKLRYSLEIANSRHGSGFVAGQVKALKKLQDTLGEAHDLHVAADRVGELADRNSEKWDEAALDGATTLRSDLLNRADKLAAKAPKRYKKFRGKKPSARLRKTFQKLEL